MMKPYYSTLEDVYVVNNILFKIIFFEKNVYLVLFGFISPR